MENDPDDLDNLFDEYESISRPEGDENVKDNGNEPTDDTTEAKAERVPVPKRVVRNPRLKFDAERLCGERGIPVLVKHFKDVKFKGKGYEKEDLNKLLASLTHWCHRLYPSMKFDDCLRQIEKLGKKRPVQTCLRKIRLGMPILNNEFVHDDEDEDEGNKNMENELPPEDEFDRLFNETREASDSNFTSTPLAKQSSGNTLGSASSSNLTEEQRQRMEYNRLLAAERRKAKLTSAVPTTVSNCVTDSDNLQELSDSTTADINSNIFEEGARSSELKSPVQNDFDSIASESIFSGMDTETPEAAAVKAPEELDIDELMDLVNDENTCIENDAETNDVSSNVPELKLNSLEGISKVDVDTINETVLSNSQDITVPREGASN